MAHVYAARALLPGMIDRGTGYLLQMASAAGLLNQIGDAAYSATKHAAVSFAESLAITHGRDGIRVSVICPQYVATPLLGYEDAEAAADQPGLLSPAAVADAVVEGIARESFLILPHPEVARFVAFKSADHDKWLEAMRSLRGRVLSTLPLPYDSAPLVAASADGDRLLASCSEDGWTRLLQRSWSEALPTLGAKAAKARETLKTKRDDADSWRALGDWFAHQGCGQAALDAYKQGGLSFAPARRASLLLRAGKRKEAAQAWQEAAGAEQDAARKRHFELCARAADSGS